MDYVNWILSRLLEAVSLPYMGIFILLSYLVKHYFSEWLQRVTNTKWQTVYTVLIIATLVAIPYWLFVEAVTWDMLLLSYALGTSLHEIIFKHLENLIKRKI